MPAINPNNLDATAHVTFDDEFATTPLSLWNGTSGTWSTTYIFADPNGNGSSLPSNGEQEWYINNNYGPTASVVPWYVQNGVLNIVAQPASATISPLINNYAYTSGVLETSHSFNQTYGYFEISAKLPSGQGIWPAFWLLPQSGAWPPELDVMEVLGQNPTALYTTVHSAAANTPGQQSYNTTIPDSSQGFHTYGVDWEPDYITWYFDNQAVYRVATPADMNSPMYMILNLAVGGSWPGNANASTPFPADMQVQWVRAYQSTSGAAIETTPTTAVAATGSGDVLTAAGASVKLTTGGNASSVVELSNGEVAGVGLASGGAATAQVFSRAGAAAGAQITLGQSGMTPTVTALQGGMFEVTYAGSTAVEVYNSSGAQVFVDNQYVTGSPLFAALGSGGYVETNTSWTTSNHDFMLVDASGKYNWIGLPTNSAGTQIAPTRIEATANGGFVFSYAGSSQLDWYSFNGGVHTTMQLASAPAGALAVANFADLVNEVAWVDGSGAVKVEGFAPTGPAMGSAVTLATGVAATTPVQMLTTGVVDNSVALWSNGGQTDAASFNGLTASSPTVVAPVALTAVSEAVLSDGNIALSWVETDNGVQNVWAEVLNPTTMQVTKQELGAGSGQIHLVALAGGGFAESWHNGSTIDVAANDGLGDYGAVTAVAGDIVGVNSSGQVVTVGVSASGVATLQDYALSGGSNSGGTSGSTGSSGSGSTGSGSGSTGSGTGSTGSGSSGSTGSTGTGSSGSGSTGSGSTGSGGSTTPPAVAITSAGGLTNHATQTVTGTGQAGTTVTLYESTSASGPFTTSVGTATVGSNGSWSITTTFAGQGAYYLEAKDAGSNGATGVSSTVAYTIDATAPAVTIGLAKDTGGSTSDEITSNPALTGAGDPNAVVHFSIDGVASTATATANASGVWSSTPTGLADGKHTITASETDAAGNSGTASTSFTLDTHAAVAAFTTFSETAVKGGSYSVTLQGTATDLTAVQSVTVYEDGSKVGAATVSNGAWSFTDAKVINADHVFTLQTVDAAGNTGSGGELLLGASGNNALRGGAGNNTFYGGGGEDTLTGGSGSNTYVYKAASDAPAPAHANGIYETITNFNTATDHIDLTALGVLSYGGQTQAMTSHHVDWYVSGGNTYVIVDVSGSSHIDMSIKLDGTHTLSSSDFLLA